MDRREFFRRAAGKASEAAVRTADAHVTRRAAAWIRPPHALPELEFLLACTRCGNCISACPHQVVFPLSARRGAQVVGTPALDLLNRGCHLCDDWPCVKACEPGALAFPAVDDDRQPPPPVVPPHLAVASIDTDHCLPYSGPECGACRDSCPVPDALVWRREQPHIDADLCCGCALCREACIATPRAVTIRSLHRQADDA